MHISVTTQKASHFKLCTHTSVCIFVKACLLSERISNGVRDPNSLVHCTHTVSKEIHLQFLNSMIKLGKYSRKFIIILVNIFTQFT